MKISKSALWLSVIDALLVLLASASGIFLVMNSKGMPTSIGIEAFIAIIIVVSLVLSVLFLREVK